MDCEFSNPVDFQGNVPASSTDFWNFKNLTCSSSLPIYLSEIQSTSTPEKNFYISNTIDLGQILMIGFFVLAFLLVSIMSIRNLFLKKS